MKYMLGNATFDARITRMIIIPLYKFKEYTISCSKLYSLYKYRKPI